MKSQIEKVSGIYKIINKIDDRFYLGRSDNILGTSGRWREHINALNAKRHDNSYLQNAWNKYGCDNFELVIIEKAPKEKLIEIEQKYLSDLKSNRRKICYNLSFSANGGGSLGYKHSEETKKRISEKLKGRISPIKGKKFPNGTNNNCDHTIYTFKNIKTNEIFIGRKYDFYTKFKFCRVAIEHLVIGKSKTSYGWIII